MMVAERAWAAALAPVAAAAATAPTPTFWHLLGYPIEAAPLIAALFAAMVTRVIIGLRAHSATYALDAAVLALVLLTVTVVVASWHPSPVGGLLYGTGLATIGEGIIRAAQRYTEKGLTALGIDVEDDAEGISDAMGQLKKLPDVPGKSN